MTKTEQKVMSTLDLYLSAFLSLQGLQPLLQINSGRVTFNFPISDDLYRLANAFNSNEPIPVADFVTAIKTLRGQMLTMRGRDDNRLR